MIPMATTDLRTCKEPGCTNEPVKPKAVLCLVHIDALFMAKRLNRIGQYVKAAEPIAAECQICHASCHPRISDLQQAGRGGCVPCGIKKRARSKSVPAGVAAQEFLDAKLQVTGEYVDANTPVGVLCLVCNTTGRTRLSVLRRGGGGCRRCGVSKANEKKRTPGDQVRSELLAAGLEMLGDYVNKTTPVYARCMTCGHEAEIWLSTVHRGGGCTPCSYDRRSRRLRTDPGLIRAELLAAGFQLIGIYINNSTTLELICLANGHRADRTWKRFRNGQRSCRKCDPLVPSRPRVPDEIVQAVFVSKGLEIIGPYQGSSIPVPSKCIQCGSRCAPTLANLRSGQGGCDVCAKHRLGETFRAPLESVVALYDSRGLEFIGPYINAHTPTAATCRRCGHRRTPKPNALLKAGGCRPCGYAPDVEGQLYLIDFDLDGEQFRKVGIGRLGAGRLDQHRALGGAVAQVLQAPFADCYEAEQQIIRQFRDDAYRPACPRFKNGHTECFRPNTPIDLQQWL